MTKKELLEIMQKEFYIPRPDLGEHMSQRFPEEILSKWADTLISAGLTSDIDKLEAENARLTSRLEKAVEFPVKVGDAILFIDGNWICSGTVEAISYLQTSLTPSQEWYSPSCIRLRFNHGGIQEFKLADFNKCWFTDYALAEAALTEKNGEEICRK